MCCAVALMLRSASGDEFRWSWSPGDGQAVNTVDNAGAFRNVRTSFNSETKELSFRVAFADRTTDGLTLVLNDGVRARGDVGRYAMLYMDASRKGPGGNVRLSAYAYNGENRGGWRDGDGVTPGKQSPDLIRSYLDRSWIKKFWVRDVGKNKRVFRFTVDASAILDHVPTLGSGDWFGMGFGERLGIWLRSYEGLRTRYSNNGLLRRWSRTETGRLDGKDLETDHNPTPMVVPLPGAAGLALAGLGLGVSGRRRSVFAPKPSP